MGLFAIHFQTEFVLYPFRNGMHYPVRARAAPHRYYAQESRLHYTSRSEESQRFEVVVENSAGKEVKLEFSFNAKNDDKNE